MCSDGREQASGEFIAENGGGPGVRLRKRRIRSGRLAVPEKSRYFRKRLFSRLTRHLFAEDGPELPERPHSSPQPHSVSRVVLIARDAPKRTMAANLNRRLTLFINYVR